MSPVEGGPAPFVLLPPPVTASYHRKVTSVTFCRKDQAGRLLVQDAFFGRNGQGTFGSGTYPFDVATLGTNASCKSGSQAR